MKNLILVFAVSLCLVNSVSCAQDVRETVQSKVSPQQVDELVYLKADSAKVSSFDTAPDWAPMPNPKATIDGDLLTRWSSGYTENQWISFDFGKPKSVSKIIIFWEAAYAVDYDILVSSDNQSWRAVKSLKDRKGGMEEIEFTPVKTQFLKIAGIKRFNPDWGISIWETLFLGPSKDNPDDKPLKEVYPKLAEKLTAKEIEVKIEEPVPSPGVLTPGELQKGIVYTSWGKTELGSPASDATLEYLSRLGVQHVAIMIVWVQETNEEKAISVDLKDTPEDSALIHAINKAHSLGMKVMLKPHVDIKTGQWRGDIIPSPEWFASYKSYLAYYAKLARLYNVELFSIGTELANTTISRWQCEWEGIIKEIRSLFPGSLTYGANWDEYKTVGFWDKLDFIGIDAYFPLTAKKDPTKEELISGWNGYAADIDRWLKEKQLSKPVIFTEIGYCSADGTNIQPWNVLSNLSEDFIDEEEQADALGAMLTACSTYPWFKGIYWWNYFPQERWSPLGYTIRGKKAEEAFSEWLKKL